MTFTPTLDALCQVNLDGVVTLDGGQTAHVQYGIGEHVAGGDRSVDPNELTTVAAQPATEATIQRTRLVPVTAGTQYTFEPRVTNAVGTGTIYFNMAFVCYGK
jgi:hypothetical protein